jgi:transposase InsO family protein
MGRDHKRIRRLYSEKGLNLRLRRPGRQVMAARRTERTGPMAANEVWSMEFVSRVLDHWAYRHGVTLDFSRPGKPTDNSYIEAFNGRLRDECLNRYWFLSLGDARAKIEVWRRDYNECRPLTSLELRTQVDEAGKLPFQVDGIPGEGQGVTSLQLRMDEHRAAPFSTFNGSNEANLGATMANASRGGDKSRSVRPERPMNTSARALR